MLTSKEPDNQPWPVKRRIEREMEKAKKLGDSQHTDDRLLVRAKGFLSTHDIRELTVANICTLCELYIKEH